MDAFGIEEGACGPGRAHYASGLIHLPDGSLRGVEEIVSIEARRDRGRVAEASRKTSDLAGSVREALASTKPISLPLRLALSTVRAGLGAIEEGLRPAVDTTFDIRFTDGASIAALMPLQTAVSIQRDAEIARSAIRRALPHTSEPLPPNENATDDALTSIFRYEKRNGRLRRIAAKPEN